jgi:hypothetical protein
MLDRVNRDFNPIPLTTVFDLQREIAWALEDSVSVRSLSVSYSLAVGGQRVIIPEKLA